MFYLTLFFIFIFGLIIGSFLNCLVWRLHTGEGMMNRSYCPKCKQQIAWYDNIPVLSFVLLGGKCRHCRQKISWQYPVVELATGIFFLITAICNNFVYLDLIANYKLLITGFIILYRFMQSFYPKH